jgi:hypothetical protein
MAIMVLVLWAFSAGVGFYLLVTGTLGRAVPPAPSAPAAEPMSAIGVAQASEPVPAASAASGPTSGHARASGPVPAAAVPASGPAPSRRAARDPWAPPSLVAARQAPVVPAARVLVEFAHPAGAIIGLGFWLGFTLVHNRLLGWIAFGLIAATACVGLGWFTANTRAARQSAPAGSAPSFAGRLVALHGSAAAVTITLAALTALVFRG